MLKANLVPFGYAERAPVRAAYKYKYLYRGHSVVQPFLMSAVGEFPRVWLMHHVG
jgi:hypothetical protein